MKYSDMPKGDNNDICVRCGRRYNFADKALWKGNPFVSKVDLVCLAEKTNAGYKTHGNVKLCGDCMNALLAWLEGE